MKTTLSRREMQVISRLAQGMNGRQVADDLNIGYETVRNYLRRARKKTGAHSQNDLIVIYRPYDIEEETLL